MAGGRLGWHDEKATYRHQAITWSPALRKIQKEWLGVEDQTDDELAAAEVNGDVVVDVSASALRVIACIPGRAGFLDACEEGGDLPAVEDLAAEHGFRAVPGIGDQVPKLYRPRKPRALCSPLLGMNEALSWAALKPTNSTIGASDRGIKMMPCPGLTRPVPYLGKKEL